MSEKIEQAFDAYCAERKRLLIEAGERTAAANMQRSPVDFGAGWEAALATPPASQESAGEAVALDCYDAGLLSDFGGGNVEWWQDYIRAELGRAHDFYQSQAIATLTAEVSRLTGELERSRKECEGLREAALATAGMYGRDCRESMLRAFEQAVALSAGEK